MYRAPHLSATTTPYHGIVSIRNGYREIEIFSFGTCSLYWKCENCRRVEHCLREIVLELKCLTAGKVVLTFTVCPNNYTATNEGGQDAGKQKRCLPINPAVANGAEWPTQIDAAYAASSAPSCARPPSSPLRSSFPPLYV